MTEFDAEFPSFAIPSMERLGERGRGAYGAVFDVKVNEKLLTAKRLHDFFRGRDMEIGPLLLSEKNEAIRKFKQECVILSKLKHPNVVQFYGVHIGPEGKEEGDISLVMESLHMDLDRCIRSPHISLSLVRKLSILRDVSCGLNYLHNFNVIHRDLNSGNVLLTQELVTAKIADLGCSKFFDPNGPQTSPMSTCPGAPDFMPPEAITENPMYNVKLDCFSFGHLSLCLWNRKMPMLEDSNLKENDIRQKQIQLAKRRSSLKILRRHDALNNLVSKCLSDSADERPSSKDILLFFNNAIRGNCLQLKVQNKKVSTRASAIGVDFGTSTFKIAYMEGKKMVDIFTEECTNSGTPTVLLIWANEQTGSTEMEVGQQALNQYCNLADSSTEHVFYQFKFDHQQDLGIESFIEGSNGNYYYAIEVIGLILGYVKRKVENYFKARKRLHFMETSQWVLTVSALWGTRAREIMREAAYMAGLSSNGNKLPDLPLSTVLSHQPNTIGSKAKNSKAISLVYKSEAAATYIYDHFGSKISGSCFLVVDVGTGTTEITACKVEEDRCESLRVPLVKHIGGSSVNDTFFKYLAQKILHDDDYSLYLQHDAKTAHNADFHVVLSESFEKAKIAFASSDTNVSYLPLKLPPSFFAIYAQPLKQLDEFSDVEIQMRTQMLRISSSKFNELMNRCVLSIKECIDSALTAFSNNTVEAIYLVGRFGGSQYILDEVRSYYSGITSVVVPDSHVQASARGACLYVTNPPLHIANATYGLGCSVPYEYDNAVPQEGEKLLSEDGKYYHSSMFLPLIHEGDPIDPLVEYKCILTPMYHAQSEMAVSLYSTTTKNDLTLTDPETGDMLEGMAELMLRTIDIRAGMEELELYERQVEVTVQFRKCEIVFTAEYNNHNKTIEVVSF